MPTVLGVFKRDTDPEVLADLVRQARGGAEVLSDHPLPVPVREPGAANGVSLMTVVIVAGLVGIGVGLFFAGGTAAMYPIMTGGKPIVALPVVGLVSFETMMLCAIVGTFGALAAKILSAEHRAPLRAGIDDGTVMVLLRVDDKEEVEEARDRLRRADAIDVRVEREHPREETR